MNLNLMAFILEIVYLKKWINKNSLNCLYVNAKNVTYFASFGDEHIPKQIRKFIGNKNIITNIYRVLAYDLIMCKYFCLGLLISC